MLTHFDFASKIIQVSKANRIVMVVLFNPNSVTACGEKSSTLHS